METLDQIDPLGAKQKNFRPGEAAARASEIIRQMRTIEIIPAIVTEDTFEMGEQQIQHACDLLATSDAFVPFSPGSEKDMDIDMAALDAQQALANGAHAPQTTRPAPLVPTEVLQRNFNPLLEILSPSWQPPAPFAGNGGKGKSTVRVFKNAANRIAHAWNCSMEEVLPPDARGKTWYSLALCTRLQRLAKATPGRRDEAWNVLEQERHIRLAASGELQPEFVRSYPGEDDSQQSVSYVESAIWESWTGITLKDVRAALKVFTKEARQLNAQQKQAEKASAVVQNRKQERKKKRAEAWEARQAAHHVADNTTPKQSRRSRKRAALIRTEQILRKEIPAGLVKESLTSMELPEMHDENRSSDMVAALDAMVNEEPSSVWGKDKRLRRKTDNEISSMLRAVNVEGVRKGNSKKRLREMQERAMRPIPTALPAERFDFNSMPSLSESFMQAGPSSHWGLASADGLEGLPETF